MQLPSKAIRWAWVLLLVVAGLRSAGSIAQTTETVPKELNGEWLLLSYYPTPNVWGISKKQAQSLLGSKLVYRNGALSACKQQVTIDKVERRDVSSTQFLAGWYVRFKDVGIVGASIREIMLNGNAGGNCFETYALPGENVYLKGPDELLVGFEGVYFRAARTSAGKKEK
jgi:hypothetical protein